MRLPRRPELPLLWRELVEQAHRPRTYVIRGVYCLVLFALFLLLLGGEFTDSVQTEARGMGGRLFGLVVSLQLAAIFLILPAMMADAITRERELNSLDLLVLTQMSLWDILLQKLLSRIVPLATLLMLSLPLLGVAYSYGGVQGLWSTVYIVLLTCFQVGAICLFMAADAPRTSTAMLSCYIRMPLVMVVLLLLNGCISIPLALLLFRLDLSVILVPPLLLVQDYIPPLWATFISTLPAMAIAVWYLRRTRRVLERVIEAHGGQPMQSSFELARVADDRSARTRGRMPADKPVAWMELTSRLMGQLNKVYWFALLVNMPIFLWLAAGVGSDRLMRQQEGLNVLVCFMWMAMAPLIAMVSASTFSGERASQTLAVLLSTPLSTAELVKQKLAGARRLALMLAGPLGLVILTEWYMEYARRGLLADGFFYIVSSALAIAIYFQLMVWLGAWIGLKIRDRGRAVVITISILVVWLFIVPVLVGAIAAVFELRADSPVYIIMPHWIVAATEWGELERTRGGGWMLMLVNAAVWGGLTALLRWHCLASADGWLGRVRQPHGSGRSQRVPRAAEAVP